MPTYEYRCSDCGTLYEVVQHIDDEPLTVCEKCNGKLRKVFHPAGIVFKGSGFYATDSRSKSKSGSSSGSSKSESDSKSEKSEKSSEKKSDSSDKKSDSSPSSSSDKKASGS